MEQEEVKKVQNRDAKLDKYEKNIVNVQEEIKKVQKDLDYLKEKIGDILVKLSNDSQQPNRDETILKELKIKENEEKDNQQQFYKLLGEQKNYLQKWRLRFSELCDLGQQIDTTDSPLLPEPGTHALPITELEVKGFINFSDIKIYNDLEPLGKGTFGTVFRGMVYGNTVAVKVMNDPVPEKGVEHSMSRSAAHHAFTQEFAFLEELRHPNILKFMGVSLIEEGEGLSPNYCLLTELAENGSLNEVLYGPTRDGNLPVKLLFNRKMAIIEEIVLGMVYLHSRNVLHLDLKPANILLDSDYHVRIADFGISKVSTHFLEGALGNFVGGTPYYMSPEILKSGTIDFQSSTKYKCDVYSFGILLNELLEEVTPYKGIINDGTTTIKLNNLKAIIEKSKRPHLYSTKGPLQTLIQTCWDDDPNNRPTFDEILRKKAWEVALRSMLNESNALGEKVMKAVTKASSDNNEILLEEFMKIIKEKYEIPKFSSEVEQAIYIFLGIKSSVKPTLPLTSVKRFLVWIRDIEKDVNLINTIKTVISTQWFFGEKSTSYADQILRDKKNCHEGAFLVRWDNEKDSFVLSHVEAQETDKAIFKKKKNYSIAHKTLGQTLSELFGINFQEMSEKYKLDVNKIPPRPAEYESLTATYYKNYLSSGSTYTCTYDAKLLQDNGRGVPQFRIVF